MLKKITKIIMTLIMTIGIFHASQTTVQAKELYPIVIWELNGEKITSDTYNFEEGTPVSGKLCVVRGTARTQRIWIDIYKIEDNKNRFLSSWTIAEGPYYPGYHETNLSFAPEDLDGAGSYKFVLSSQYYNEYAEEYITKDKTTYYVAILKKVKCSVSFDVSSMSLLVGETQPIFASVYPASGDQSLTWSSSKSNVASVSNYGDVTGNKAGSATITAKTWSGGTAKCSVRVLFHDVPASGVYYSTPVYWAVDNGITAGFTDDDGLARTFGPQLNCTRAQVVTFLWRLAGKPNPSSMTSKFSDVQDSSLYYYKAVLWAAQKGITGGYEDGTFRPDDTCLREHVVTFLWRYAKKPSPKTSSNPFNDIQPEDYYYKAAVWANEKGIAKGYSEGEYAGGFGPKLDCLREHVVTFLYRYAK